MNRNDITYGIRDAEIYEAAVGVYFLELLASSYILGVTESPAIGGLFFLVVFLSNILSRTLSTIIMSMYTIAWSVFIFKITTLKFDEFTCLIFTLIAFVISGLYHINAFSFFHE